jgi:formate dehydrogenase (hydrogenase)
VKHDWEIYGLLATALGYPMHYDNTEQIWNEMTALGPSYKGATYEKMAGLSYLQRPCPDEMSGRVPSSGRRGARRRSN